MLSQAQAARAGCAYSSVIVTPATHTRPAVALNAEQRTAAEHPAGGPALLVVAGAGSGKTATLAARVAWLVSQGAALNRMLLVTFSRRAAGEMQRRVARLLAQDRALPLAAPAHLPWCGTFHAVAARLLRDEAPHIGLARGFTLLDRGDAEDLMGVVRQRLGLADAGPQGRRFPLAGTCLAIHSRQVNTQAALPELLDAAWPWCSEHAAALKELFDAYGAAKRVQQALDLDDLLLAWWHLMQLPAPRARIAARFDHVLVDEWQDVNRLQADIVHALRPGGIGLTAVGDDAQAIYAFRGSDVRHMLDLPARCTPPARVLKLERNHRSTPAILATSNALMAEAGEGFAKRLWSEREDIAPVRLHTVADEAAQAEGVADAVLAAREGGLQLKQQAVLFRNSSACTALEFELLRRGIPFVKYGGLRFFDTAHVKDVLALLRWAAQPACALAAWRAARLVPGMGPAAARRLLDHAAELTTYTPPRASQNGWQSLLALLHTLRSGELAWPADLHAALAWYRPQLERLHPDAPARWADLEQLGAIAARSKSRDDFLTEMALDPPEASSEDARDPLLDEDYLILSTIHSAKGQEWNAVHVLNVVDGCMPADMATGSAAEIEEERRLLYVAMTRARDELTLWAPQRFYVTQQRRFGDRHLYAQRSRFLTPAVMATLEVGAMATVPAEVPTQVTGIEPVDVLALLRGGGE
jgi:DNA helicase II / ATP-dependent DNA helicase PcrA